MAMLIMVNQHQTMRLRSVFSHKFFRVCSGQHEIVRLSHQLRSLLQPCTHKLEVKHSKFIAHASAINSPKAAFDFINQVQVPDATHNCWAYKLGDDIERSFDDGEVAGTAGRRILAAINSQHLTNVIVVVVRHYGGIKLGAGGLSRAYQGVAKECLQLSPYVDVVPMILLRCSIEPSHLGLAYAVVAQYSLESKVVVNKESYSSVNTQNGSPIVHLDVSLPSDLLADFENSMKSKTKGGVQLSILVDDDAG